AVEGAGETSPHLAPVVRTVRVADHLEAVTIMTLDQFGDRDSHRVLTKIRGKITEPNAPAASRLRAREHGGFGDGHLGSDPANRVELLRGCGGQSQQYERGAECRLQPDRPSDPGLVLAIAGPIANELPPV